MRTQSTLGIAAVILVVIGGVYALTRPSTPNTPPVQNTNQQTPGTSDSTETSNSPTSATSTKTYTLQEVAQHASESSCWTVIDGSVYDVTAGLTRHPGGKTEIMKSCGIDATQLFATKDEKGKPHSTKAKEMLANFYIGDLATR